MSKSTLTLILSAVLSAGLLVGCGSKTDPVPAPGGGEMVQPSVDEAALKEQFDKEAEKNITADNAEEELKKLEEELNADTE